MQMMEGDEFRQRRKLLTPMMGRGQLTKIATTVAYESPTAWPGGIDSLIPANG